MEAFDRTAVGAWVGPGSDMHGRPVHCDAEKLCVDEIDREAVTV